MEGEAVSVFEGSLGLECKKAWRGRGWSQGGPGGGHRSGVGWAWLCFGCQLSPVSIGPGSPRTSSKLGRDIFSYKLRKLPAFPPFLSDLFPAWPPNLFPFLLPSPVISDSRMFALAPTTSCPLSPAASGGYSAKSAPPASRPDSSGQGLSPLYFK